MHFPTAKLHCVVLGNPIQPFAFRRCRPYAQGNHACKTPLPTTRQVLSLTTYRRVSLRQKSPLSRFPEQKLFSTFGHVEIWTRT